MESIGRLEGETNNQENYNSLPSQNSGFCSTLSPTAKTILVVLVIMAIIAAIVIPIAIVIGKQKS